MRTSDAGIAVTLVALVFAVLACGASGAQAGGEVQFASPDVAYDQGMSSLRSGYVEKAVPALEYAASKNNFLARFYLARLYADRNTPYKDPAKAFTLYMGIVSELLDDVDTEADQRAPFVAKSLTAVAGYLRTGLPEIDLHADPERSLEYLKHAATYFNDEGAQFELAKSYLDESQDAESARRGIDWLSTLAQRGHSGAQAQLADELWIGKHVGRDPLRAFALSGLAVETAPASDRIWIEDVYQNIYCAASEETRRRAEVMVAEWRRKYARNIDVQDHSLFANLQPRTTRRCANGEVVKPFDVKSQGPDGATATMATTQTPSAPPPAMTPLAPSSPSITIAPAVSSSDRAPVTGALPGNMMGFAVKDAGVTGLQNQ